MPDQLTGCESEQERLRALVREARHFARWMRNPMGIVGKNKAKAVAWLDRADEILDIGPWVCPRCGASNDPDEDNCGGRFAGGDPGVILCEGRAPRAKTVTG